MADRYQQLINTPVGKILSKQIGLPSPIPLQRYEPGQPVIDGPVLFGAAAGSTLTAAIAQALASVDAEVRTPLQEEARQAAADAGIEAGIFNPETADEEDRFKALVFDASGIADPADLVEAY
jgi:3-oxoacyl-[acyl-carrier protein] reductase